MDVQFTIGVAALISLLVGFAAAWGALRMKAGHTAQSLADLEAKQREDKAELHGRIDSVNDSLKYHEQTTTDRLARIETMLESISKKLDSGGYR